MQKQLNDSYKEMEKSFDEYDFTYFNIYLNILQYTNYLF